MKLVRFKGSPDLWDSPLKEGELLLMLGEIDNALGHVAVVDRQGKVHWMYHTENFIEEE